MLLLLLKASLVLALCWAFYKLVLERESFFAANRIYLLAGLGLSFILPFLSLPQLIDQQGFVEQLVAPVPVERAAASPSPAPQPTVRSPVTPQRNPISDLSFSAEKPVANASTSNRAVPAFSVNLGWSGWLLLLYGFGVLVSLANLLIQLFSVIRNIRRNSDQIPDDDGVIVNMAGEVEPCSFFQYIFINPTQYDFETYEQIIAHEKIHVAKGHSIDLLLAELVIVVLWFNPFAWLFRREIEKNIEYQTDDLVIRQHNAPKASYQLSLLRISSGSKPMAVTTHYNQSLVKQRILKMNTKKSTPFRYWKYTFLLPFLATILVFLNRPTPGHAEGVAPSYVEAEASPASVEAHPQETPFNAEGAAEVSATNSATPPISETSSTSDCQQLLAAAKSGDMTSLLRVLKRFDVSCLPNPSPEDLEHFSDIRQAAETAENVNIDAGSGYVIVRLAPNRKALIDLNEMVKGEIFIKTADRPGLDRYDPFYTEGELSAGSLNSDCKQLLRAIRAQDVNKVRELLATTDPNCVDRNPDFTTVTTEEGHTWHLHEAKMPLVAAGRLGHLELAEILVDAGAKVNGHASGEESALVAAAESGSLPLVMYLLELGANLNEKSDGWGDALNAAARRGHLKVVAFLLDQGAVINAQTNGQGSALNAAARNGYRETVQLLIDAGADVNLQNNGQGSPLNAAARNNQLEAARLLLQNGAEIDGRTNGQGSALNAAARNGHLDMIRLLLDEGAAIDLANNGQGSALNAAARNGHLEAARLLLSRGAEVDAQTTGQGSALNAAARNQHLDMVRLLLDEGAAIDLANNGQGSALNAAARNGHLETVRLLLSRGAEIDVQTTGQGSALNAAARNGHLDVIRLLLDEGAAIDLANNGQGSALNAAARNGHLAAVKLLVERGAEINLMTQGQGTALSAARRNRQHKVAKWLIDNGANPDLKPN